MKVQGGATHVSSVPGWFGTWHLGMQRSGLLVLDAASRKFGAARTQPAHLLVGERGELEALFFLRRQGYVVTARRWRSPELNGDLDLVAWEGETLCFIEVKSRSKRDQTPAALAIGQAKRRMLSRMAWSYLRTLPWPNDRSEGKGILTRFDFVSVYLLPGGVECELLRDAYDWKKDQNSRYGV